MNAFQLTIDRDATKSDSENKEKSEGFLKHLFNKFTHKESNSGEGEKK